MTGDPAGACQVVVGVGLNVDMPEGAAAGIDQPWTDVQSNLRHAGMPPASRNALTSALISELLLVLRNFELQGFAAYRQERSEEHTSELQSRGHLVCRLLLEKKKC